jgi:hypothetical protein
MAKRSRTHQVTASILGQHLALSVAAGLARTQLVPEPLKVYDAQHLTELLNVVARALAKVAPLYVQDPQSGAPRELSQDELQDVEVRRGATLVVLKDGRKLSGASMKRADLRQAVAILKAVGIPELVPPPRAPAGAPRPAFDPLAQLAEINRLLQPPLVAGQAEQANRLAVALARSAPDGRVANFAMHLISAVHEGDSTRVKLALVRLRATLEESVNASSGTEP